MWNMSKTSGTNRSPKRTQSTHNNRFVLIYSTLFQLKVELKSFIYSILSLETTEAAVGSRFAPEPFADSAAPPPPSRHLFDWRPGGSRRCGRQRGGRPGGSTASRSSGPRRCCVDRQLQSDSAGAKASEKDTSPLSGVTPSWEGKYLV